MIPANSKIIVRVNMRQKTLMKIGDLEVQTANIYETNYREKSPTVCEVVEGNKYLKEGDVLITHHNLFYPPSPFFLYEDLFSIPFSKVIFAKLDSEGILSAVCGNLLGSRIDIPTVIELPPEQRKQYNDRVLISDKGWSKYKVGQTVIARPSAAYDIIYFVNKERRVITKISEDMVCAVVR